MLVFKTCLVGADPHAKNVLGISFADLVPQYEKIVANLPFLRGEVKSAIKKPNYFTTKQSQSDRLVALVLPPAEAKISRLGVTRQNQFFYDDFE